jgi:hypothetical protein
MAGTGAACEAGGAAQLRSSQVAPSSQSQSAPPSYTQGDLINALTAAGVKLCRDPGIKGADLSGAYDHGYWTFDAHPQPARIGVAGYTCVADNGQPGVVLPGVDVRMYPSSTVARQAAEDFVGRGGTVSQTQDIWLWNNLGIYVSSPSSAATAAHADDVVSHLPGVTHWQPARS